MTQNICPRCGAARSSGTECPRCGIIYDKYRADKRPALQDCRTVPPPPHPFWRRMLRWGTLPLIIPILLMLLWRAPAPESLSSPEAIQAAQVKLIEHQRLSQAGRPHTLELNQPELNGWLETRLALAPENSGGGNPAAAQGASFAEDVSAAQSNVREVKIELLDDSLRAYVIFDFHGLDLTLELAGRLLADSGYMRFEPSSGRLGRLPIPQSALRRAVRRLFDAPENREKFRLPPEVADIGIRQGKFYLACR